MKFTNVITSQELISDLLESPFVSFRLRRALIEFSKADPLDALGDAEVLVKCLQMKWDEIMKEHAA